MYCCLLCVNLIVYCSILRPPHAKSWLIGKDPDAGRGWGQEEKGTTEDEMAGWHHRLDGHEFEWTPRVGDGQAGLVCCDSWGRKKSDATEQLNWIDCSLAQMCWPHLIGFVCGSFRIKSFQVLKDIQISFSDSWGILDDIWQCLSIFFLEWDRMRRNLFGFLALTSLYLISENKLVTKSTLNSNSQLQITR